MNIGVLIPSGYHSLKNFNEPLERTLMRTFYQPEHGYLSGSFPESITSVGEVPSLATVRVLHRASGFPFDGIAVAETTSELNGTWQVGGLNPNLKFDIVARIHGYNDVIIADVSPALSTGLEFDGSFTTVDDQVQIQLGTGPYLIDVVSGTPPDGVTFTTQGNYIVAIGEPENYGQFTFSLRVIDSNWISGSFESVMAV